MDYERFARIVHDRRTELGLTQEEVDAAGGPTDTTIGKIENAEWTPGNRWDTLRKLDTGLRWEPGSAKRTLNGGDPTPLPASDVTPHAAARRRAQQMAEYGEGDPTDGEHPQYAEVAAVSWRVLMNLVESPADDPDRHLKAAEAVAYAGDFYVESLLALNIGPKGRSLLEDIFTQSSEAKAVLENEGITDDLEVETQSDAPTKGAEDKEAGLLDESELSNGEGVSAAAHALAAQIKERHKRDHKPG